MALMEKGLAFALTEIGLDDKPAWFLTLSPYAKVPLLRHGEAVIYESAVINEYIEEVFPEHPLLPPDPVRRAEARLWIDFANVRFIPPIYRLLMSQEAQTQARQRERLDAAFSRMEAHLAGRRGGAFWLGDALGLADLAFYPHLERFCALEYYRDYGIPKACGRMRAWLELIRSRPSAASVAKPDDLYVRNWAKYAGGGGDGTTAHDMREM